MKQKIILLSLIAFLLSCGYPYTKFIVQNNTDEAIQFEASAYIPAQRSFRSLTFIVHPDSSVLVRHIGLSDKGNVTDVFKYIHFYGSYADSIKDPLNPEKWKKSTDSSGKPIYIFIID